MLFRSLILFPSHDKGLIAPQGSNLWSGFCIGPSLIYYIQKAPVNGLSGWSSGVAHGMSLNTWYHISIERHGDSINYYINGILIGTEAISGTFNQDIFDSFLSVCQISGTNFLEASIFNLRISSAALYHGSGFSPPSTEYTLTASDTTTSFIGFNKASWSYTIGPGFKPPNTISSLAPSASTSGFIFFNPDTPFTVVAVYHYLLSINPVYFQDHRDSIIV